METSRREIGAQCALPRWMSHFEYIRMLQRFASIQVSTMRRSEKNRHSTQRLDSHSAKTFSFSAMRLSKPVTWCLLFFSAARLSSSEPQDSPAHPSFRTFHGDLGNVTVFYPDSFSSAQADDPIDHAKEAEPCPHTLLNVRSTSQSDGSTFAISSIEEDCPDDLRKSSTLEAFVRSQLLLQLNTQGSPSAPDYTATYSIANHHASLAFGYRPQSGHGTSVDGIYGVVKVCALGDVPLNEHKKKKSSVELTGRIYCFDFTTQSRYTFTDLYSFLVSFGGGPPQTIFQANAVRGIAAKVSANRR